MPRIKKLLQELYPEKADYVWNEVNAIVGSNVVDSQTSGWYKNINAYVVYPDSFVSNGKATLDQLAEKLPYLEKMGIELIHILPFLASPQIDTGFDVSDYLSVRSDVGGNTAFEKLLVQAKQRGIRIMMDIILNHISNQHEWFKKAIEGDEKYRNFFVYTKDKLKLIKQYVCEKGPFAKYEFNGKEYDFRIIFPDFVGELPHWVQGEDGYWYFHTFYPHQLDVDWNNPEVFVEFAKILIYWAKKGVSFRLDATIFLGKHVFEGEYESPPNVHKFIRALNAIMHMVSKDSVFLAEAVQDVEVIKQYYGDKNEIECEMTYNFPLMSNLWAGFLQQNCTSLYKVIEDSWRNIPSWAGWVNFIRNHDGLSLEFVDEKCFKLCHEHLGQEGRGVPFMSGFNIAGRTASFLDGDEPKLLTMHFVLASLPGTLALIYGDEIGKENDFKFMREFTDKKRKLLNDFSIVDDPRDINRGQVTDDDLLRAKEQIVYDSFCKILSKRKELKRFFIRCPERVKCSDRVLGLRYVLEDEELLVYVNIGKENEWVDVKGDVVLNMGNVKRENEKYSLGSMSGVWMLSK